MKKWILLCFLLSISILISACQNNPNPHNLVKITSEQNGKQHKSTGFILHDDIIITSHHNLWERIRVNNDAYSVIFADQDADIAILSNQNTHYTPQFTTGKVWDTVFAFVWRNNEIIKIYGKITHISPTITAYNQQGMQTIYPRIMTDLVVENGDSGSPIWNTSGEMLDVIHIQQQ